MAGSVPSSPTGSLAGSVAESVGISRATIRLHTRRLRGDTARVPRMLHPVAWWVWAIGCGVAVSLTDNPLLLALVLAMVGFVVAARRSDAPWARAFKYYLAMALAVIAIRVVFRAIFAVGGAARKHVLFTLPRLHLPHWYTGVQIGGPVTLESTLAAASDGLRLGTLLCCLGAANVLANPKRLLRVLPGALYEIGVAVVVALTAAPQLVESVQRVRRARRVRAGGQRGVRSLRAVAVPVLEDALERSLMLAASMDCRGYGRVGTATRGSRRLTAALLLGGLAGLCAGTYGLLDASSPPSLGLPTLLGGSALCCGGLYLGSRRVRRGAYRPDPWRTPEWIVSGGGVACAAAMIVGSRIDPLAMTAVGSPLRWPTVPLLPVAGVLVAGVAALAAPPPRRTGDGRTSAGRADAPARDLGPSVAVPDRRVPA